MKKGHLLIIIICVTVVILIAFAFVWASEKRVEQLQAALRNSYQHLANAGNQLTEAATTQKQLEYKNQKLISYIDAKEAQDNREPIGFKTELIEDSNNKKINS